MSALPDLQPQATYILPLKWADDRFEDSLTAYLEWLCTRVSVIVVDGSNANLYAKHKALWSDFAVITPPQQWVGANKKVAGVVTGLRLAKLPLAVIADDDVRYTEEALGDVLYALRDADLVRPQNYFLGWPWHARWDNARTLINRAVGSDYPGTLGIRITDSLRSAGYSGHALFENLELIRTVAADGGREVRLDTTYVGRLPPSFRHFVGQRVRQAYDDFAQPARLVVELAILPAMVIASKRPGALALILGATSAVAEVGRLRHGGRAVFSATSALWAPLWVIERGLCIWIAVGLRALGGVKYNGERLRLAAHTVSQLRDTRRGNDEEQANPRSRLSESN